MGDIVLNSSLFPAIKKKWGDDIRISFLTSDEFSDLYENYEFVDEVLAFSRKKSLKDLGNLIRNYHALHPIDLMVDMHGTLRSLYLRFTLPFIPRVYVDKRTIERSLLTWAKIDILSIQNKNGRKGGFGEPLLERNYRDFSSIWMLESLESYKENLPFKASPGQLSSCSLTGIENVYEDDILKRFEISGKYIVFIPSASYPEKRWATQNFYKLIMHSCEQDEFNEYRFVILAGPSDSFCEIFNDLTQSFPQRVFNLQGKTTIKESLAIVKKADFCVGNDTGVPHFGESVGTPSLFILGPTGEEFGFYPHLEKSRTIFKEIWCRPCTTNGKGRCIRSERFCLTHIKVSEVYDLMNQMRLNL